MNLTSRNVLFSSGIILFPFASSVSQNIKEVENNQPNVIFILADDLGIGDLGCYGQKIIKTPTIDRLASEGMIFSQHYSGTTVSAPSRCSLLTGKNTGHTYVRGNKGYKNADGREYDTPLPTTEITVAEIFKQKNYKTACFGKWGLGGPNTEGSPVNQGFDYFFGYLGQGDAHKSFPKLLFENNKPVVLNGKVYAHDTIMAKALQYINTNAKAPFFIYLTPTIPHAELAVPTGEMMGYEGKFPEVPFAGKGSYGAQAEPKATYAAMVSRLDRDIQRLVDLLKQKGILNNTLIIFTSDNGAHKEGGNDPDFFD
ncbi:MAG: sulfatase-like hydrolase/transferase, partial [Bacteroidia bacterium]|nr:sulfatase-like hydrolase/transferase [Bacteroidia bacterium]